MQLLRITLVVLALAAAVAPPAWAQRNPLAGARGQGFTSQIFRDIELDARRQTMVDSILAEYRGAMHEIRNGRDDLSDDAARAKFNELMEKQIAEVRALLTPKEQTLFDRNVARWHQRRTEQVPPERQP